MSTQQQLYCDSCQKRFKPAKDVGNRPVVCPKCKGVLRIVTEKPLQPPSVASPLTPPPPTPEPPSRPQWMSPRRSTTTGPVPVIASVSATVAKPVKSRLALWVAIGASTTAAVAIFGAIAFVLWDNAPAAVVAVEGQRTGSAKHLPPPPSVTSGDSTALSVKPDGVSQQLGSMQANTQPVGLQSSDVALPRMALSNSGLPPLGSRGLATAEAISDRSESQSGGSTSYYRKTWAVIVGIDQYTGADRNLPNLLNAENDAREFWTLLQEDFGYSAETAKYLVNDAATLAALKAVFQQWLPTQDLTADDAIIFFFAGHGLIDSRNQGWLAASDSTSQESTMTSTCLSVEWLRDHIGKLPCKHKLIILDSCYSGALFMNDAAADDQTAATAPATAQTRGASQPASTRLVGDNLQVLSRAPAFFGMTAGRNTPVADGLGSKRHSVFTAALLEVMRERANTTQSESVFTFRTAAAQIADRVVNALGSAQIPEYGKLATGDGDVIFRPTIKRLTPREQARRTTYVQQLAKCQQEIAANNLAAALESLDNCSADQRGWEWRHLKMQVSPEIAVFRVGTEKLVGAALDSEKGRIVASNDSGGLLMWTASGELLDDLGTPSSILAMAFHPRTHALSMAPFDLGAIAHIPFGPKFSRPTDGMVIGDPVTSIAYTPDGTLLLCGTLSGQLTAWSSPHNKLVRTFKPHEAAAFQIRVSSDGKRMITASHDRTARLYRIAQDKPDREFLGHEDWVADAAIAPGGGTVVTVSKDESLRIFDSADGRILKTISEPAAINAIIFSSDGQLAATASWDGRIRIYDTASWTLARTLSGHASSVSRLVADHKEHCFYSASLDATVRKWSWSTGSGLVAERVKGTDLVCVAASSRGARAMGANDGSIRIETEGRLLDVNAAHSGTVWGMAFDRDGALLATVGFDAMIQIWDALTGKKVIEIRGNGEPLKMVAFHPTERRIAACEMNGAVSVWDSASGRRLVRASLGTAPVLGIGFVDGGKRLITGSGDGTLHLLDSATGASLSTSQFGDSISAFALSPSGSFAVIGGRGGRVGVSDTSNLAQVWFADRHADIVKAVSFAADERRVFSSGDDQTVRCWHVETGQEMLTMRGGGAPVSDLCAGPGDALTGVSPRGDVWTWKSTAEPPRPKTQFRPVEADSIHSLIGTSAVIRVVGDLDGAVWGVGPYRGESAIFTAAVHAGLVKNGESGVVRYIVVEAPRQFVGSLANGVQSHPFGEFPSAFRLENVVEPLQAGEEVVDVTELAKVLRAKAGGLQTVADSPPEESESIFRIRVTGSLSGSVWGVGPYTADSRISVAAVHAGLVNPGKTAVIVCRFVTPPQAFIGGTAHGVTTRPFGQFPQAYTLSADDKRIRGAILNAEDLQ